MSDITPEALPDEPDTKVFNIVQSESDAGRRAWSRPSLRRLDLREAELNPIVGGDAFPGKS